MQSLFLSWITRNTEKNLSFLTPKASYMNPFIPIFSAFFILLGLLVRRFPKLIAGYNTMTPEQQKKVDVKGLKVFTCRVFCIIGVVVFVSYLLLRFFTDEASAINISSIVVPITGVIYLLANSQRYVHN